MTGSTGASTRSTHSIASIHSGATPLLSTLLLKFPLETRGACFAVSLLSVENSARSQNWSETARPLVGQTPVVRPTKDDARHHASLILNASEEQITRLAPNVVEVSGVRFVFAVGDSSRCIVYRDGFQPHAISGLVWPSRKAVKVTDQSLRRPTRGDAIQYAQLLREAASQGQLGEPLNEGKALIYRVSGAQYRFTEGNPLECEVRVAGLQPFRITGVALQALRAIPEESAPSQQQPGQAAGRAVQHIDAKYYYKLLADSCECIPLGTENFANGYYRIVQFTIRGPVVFELRDREGKRWHVEAPGVPPFWIKGIPHAVAARIFAFEGKVALAAQEARLAGITLTPIINGASTQEDPSQMQTAESTPHESEAEHASHDDSCTAPTSTYTGEIRSRVGEKTIKVPGTQEGRKACAWVVNDVFKKIHGDTITGLYGKPSHAALSVESTIRTMRAHPEAFQEVSGQEAADSGKDYLIASNTSYGATGSHIGWGNGEEIWSNSTGARTIRQNYTRKRWASTFGEALFFIPKL